MVFDEDDGDDDTGSKAASASVCLSTQDLGNEKNIPQNISPQIETRPVHSIPPRPLNPYRLRTIPNTLTNLGRNLPSPKPLINEPHPHHKFFLPQNPLSEPINYIPYLSQLIIRKATPLPNFSHRNIDNMLVVTAD
jgi:hypothetical protein